MATQVDARGERKAYYDRISRNNLAPLWEILHGLLPSRPQPPELRSYGTTTKCAHR